MEGSEHGLMAFHWHRIEKKKARQRQEVVYHIIFPLDTMNNNTTIASVMQSIMSLIIDHLAEICI